MGRVGSLYGLLEGILVIILTVLIGVGAEVVSIRAAVVGRFDRHAWDHPGFMGSTKEEFLEKTVKL